MFPPLRMRNLLCSKNNSRNYNFAQFPYLPYSQDATCSVSFCVDYENEHIYKGSFRVKNKFKNQRKLRSNQLTHPFFGSMYIKNTRTK